MRTLTSKYWLATTIALLLSVGLVVSYLWLSSDGSAETHVVSEPEEHIHSSVAHDHPKPQFPSRKLRQAWLERSSTAIDPIVTPPNLPKDSTYVTLAGDYEQWLIGTPVEVFIPQTKKRYRSIVHRIAPDDFGNTAIHANPAEGEDEFLQLIVTMNDSHTFAYVSTVGGSYELVGSKEGGWLIPSQSLHENIDFSVVDVLKTRRDRHANTKYVPRRED